MTVYFNLSICLQLVFSSVFIPVYLVLCYFVQFLLSVYNSLQSICLQLKSSRQSIPVYLVLCYLLFNSYCLFITVYFNLSICLQYEVFQSILFT